MICTSKNGHRWTKKPLAISHGRPSFRRSSSTNRQFHRYATKSPEGIPILSQETILKHNSKLVQILSTISSWDNLSSWIYSFSQNYRNTIHNIPPFAHHFPTIFAASHAGQGLHLLVPWRATSSADPERAADQLRSWAPGKQRGSPDPWYV